MLGYSGMEGKVNIQFGIHLKETSGQPGNEFHPQRPQKPQANQALAAGAFSDRGDPCVQCGQGMFCADKEFFTEACD